MSTPEALTNRGRAIQMLRSLIALGYAGLDEHDPTRFLIDAPDPFLEQGERALDDLGAYFLNTHRLGELTVYVAALLPSGVRAELGLDRPGAPRLSVPLAFERRDRGLEKLRDDIRAAT